MSARYSVNAKPGGVATHIDGLIEYLENNDIKTYLCYHKSYRGINDTHVLNVSKVGWLFAVVQGMFVLIFNKDYHFFDYSINDIIITAYYISILKIFLKKLHVDFVHIHSLHNPATIALDIINYKGRIIVTDHGFFSNKNYTDKRTRIKLCKNYSIANKVIYISEFALQKHLESKLGDSNKLIKIPNPTDFSKYPVKKIYTSQGGPKRLFFNGYVKSRDIKKLVLLLSSMNTYPELYKNMELIVLCDSEMDNYIKERTWNFVYKLVGKTTLENIFNIYCNVDLLVVPSKSESFGLVYTEALAVGIPVIGFYGVIDEFKTVLNTYIGESFDPSSESEEALKEKIAKCLNTPFDAALVRNNLIKNFSWETLGQLFISLYYPIK